MSSINNNDDTRFTNTEPKRVKVYVLENNEWKDSGTGYCTGEISNIGSSDKKAAYLIVNNEEFPSETLLRSKLEGNIEYQRQEETLIVWKDLEGHDIALSFEESVGCDILCEFIVQVQRHVENNISLVAVRSSDNGIGSVHEIITGPVSLPSVEGDQNTQKLLDALKILNENTSYEFLKNETIEFVLQSKYIDILIKHFEKAEKEKLLKDLFLLSSIIKTLILYNQRDIIELMVDDVHIMGVIGILEYDTEFPTLKANHRQYLKSSGPSFKEVLPLNNNDLKTIVKKCFRLQFLKDVVLVTFLDDNNFNLILDIILDLETCIIDFLQVDQFLDNIIELYNPTKMCEPDMDTADFIEKRKDGIKLLHQCVQMSKNLDPIDKTKFYKSLVRKGLFNMLTYAFNNEKDSNIRILATDTVITIIEHDILLIQTVQHEKLTLETDQQKSEEVNKADNTQFETEDMKLLSVLSTILLTDKSPGLREQVVQALNTLLHPDGCLSNGENDYDNSPGGSTLNEFAYGINSEADQEFGQNMKNSYGSQMGESDDSSMYQLNRYFSNFYTQVAPILFKPLINAENVADDHLLIYLVKLISFIATEHNRLMSRKFILERGILKNISKLMGKGHILQLRLTALRCFKNIMVLDDKYYHRYMISNNLYDSVFTLLEENLNCDNLANSSVQDFFRIIVVDAFPGNACNNDRNDIRKGRTNFILFAKYLRQKYLPILKKASHIKYVAQLIQNEDEEQILDESVVWSRDDDLLGDISNNSSDTNRRGQLELNNHMTNEEEELYKDNGLLLEHQVEGT